jgi:ankyrin repeat protein
MYRLKIICLIALVAPITHAETATEPARVRTALAKSIPLLQQTGKVWFAKQACTSCHHSTLPTLALMSARRHGVSIDESAARTHFRQAYSYLTNLDSAAQGAEPATLSNGDSYALWAANEAGLPQNTGSSAMALMLARQQASDGHWRTPDMRPPQSGSLFTVTALSLRAVASYLPPSLNTERNRRIARARQWLETNTPGNTEDAAFRLLGAEWSGSKPAVRKEYARQLMAQQRPDGGWAQITTRPSDAYASGQVLFALIEGAGIPVEDSAIQRGFAYLVDAQLADGSWLVQSRMHYGAPLSPRYFETGFPHGQNQVASCSGTSWAVMALSLGLPLAESQPFSLKELVPARTAWAETVLFGSAAELRKLDPNKKTDAGTTALMLAASDPEKTKILLDRGADVNARAKSGFSALTIGPSFGGNAATLRLLLDRGAVLESPPEVRVLFDRTPLMHAIIAGDLESVELLLDHHPNLRQKSMVFGGYPIRPLMMAVDFDELTIARDLVQNGALIDEADPAGMTALERAATFGYAGMVDLLARLGGDPNHVDKEQMTPLLWASTIEFGSAETVSRLLAAGARPDLAGKDGVTPLTQAGKYGLVDVQTLLRANAKGPR